MLADYAFQVASVFVVVTVLGVTGALVVIFVRWLRSKRLGNPFVR